MNEDLICTHCNGSGEGVYDETTCHYCHGGGEQTFEEELDSDLLYEIRRQRRIDEEGEDDSC